jgi:hypothetical protein
MHPLQTPRLRERPTSPQHVRAHRLPCMMPRPQGAAVGGGREGGGATLEGGGAAGTTANCRHACWVPHLGTPTPRLSHLHAHTHTSAASGTLPHLHFVFGQHPPAPALFLSVLSAPPAARGRPPPPRPQGGDPGRGPHQASPRRPHQGRQAAHTGVGTSQCSGGVAAPAGGAAPSQGPGCQAGGGRGRCPQKHCTPGRHGTRGGQGPPSGY